MLIQQFSKTRLLGTPPIWRLKCESDRLFAPSTSTVMFQAQTLVSLDCVVSCHRAHRGDHQSQVGSVRPLIRDTTQRGPYFPCEEARNKMRQVSTPSASSSEILRTTKSLNKDKGPLRCGWFYASGTKLTLGAKRQESNQRDSPSMIATKCDVCFCPNDSRETM